MYFDELLPRLAKNGDDGNYAVAADADLACLQVRKQCHTPESITNVCIVRYKATTVTAENVSFPQVLSRRINYGRYVAEVKFRGDQQTYTSLIQAKVYIQSEIF
jgi:chorismate mutase